MKNKEIIEKLEEHQREIENMDGEDVDAIIISRGYDPRKSKNKFVHSCMAGVEHGLQIAIDLLEMR